MSDAPDRFAELMARDESEIDLARACLMIAEDAYPELDIDGYLGEIERYSVRLRGRLPPGDRAARWRLCDHRPGLAHTRGGSNVAASAWPARGPRPRWP